ncbi:MAG TPA: phospholipase D family protein [Pirellulales bacterium]|nr:phospholipase D family protein [Pirellulales bacterium]HVA50615.1 phospholipase D family protein [Pirellulales bacterium]HVA50626.1 phospholipase D family protein [Pirellulales bacterium]
MPRWSLGAWSFGALAIVVSLARSAPADAFRLLASDHEAAQARVDLIDQATVSIETSYYWIGNDRIGAMFLSRLEAAARRGVRVRLVVDAEHNDVPLEVEALLIRSGVEIREYHPVGLRHPLWINYRMHDKTLVVDGKHLIVGSRNIREPHFGLAEINFVDRDAYLRGPTARQVQRYFECLWTCAEVAPPDLGRQPHRRRERSSLDLTKVGVRQVTGPLSPQEAARLWLEAASDVAVGCQPILGETETDWSAAGTRQTECLRFVFDPCGRKGHPRGISRQLIDLIDGARSSILFETPYFLMSSRLKRALAGAIARGVQVRVLTNSLETTDHRTLTAGFTNQKQCFLLPRGVDVWELAGDDRHLHAKSAVFDGSIAFVGSYNFDPRAEYLNTETGVIINAPEIAAWVESSIRDHMRGSYHIGSDGRDRAEGRRFPGASAGQILNMEPLRFVAPLVRRCL